MFSWRHQAPHPQPPSLGRCRPSRDGNRQPRPLEAEETRPPSRVHQAHTVPGSYYGARGSQPNVADLFAVSFWAKIYGTLTIGYDYYIVPYIPDRHGIPSERTGLISAHETPLSAPCSPPPEIWRLADVCCYCCCCILLQLLLLCCGYCPGYCFFSCCKLLRGCDENRAGDSRLVECKMCDGSGPFFLHTKQKKDKNCKSLIKNCKTIWGIPSDPLVSGRRNAIPCQIEPAQRRLMRREPPRSSAEIRDPDMLHDVLMAALLTPNPKVR